MSIVFCQPYTTPYLTRRPLAERVPECVPRRDEITALAIDPKYPANWAWVHSCQDPCCKIEHESVNAMEAAALWQVAVEDWATETGNCLGVRVTREGTWVLWGVTEKPTKNAKWLVMHDGERYWHEWFDDLNAAAHAVADALGIEY